MKKGFTLIELIIAIFIICVLASIILMTMIKAKSKSRDQQRITELNSIAQALGQYYSDNHSYPYWESTKSKNGVFSSDNKYCESSYQCIYNAAQGTSWNDFNSKYLKSQPTSPKKGLAWQYYFNASSSEDLPPDNFAIGAKLEGSQYAATKTKADNWYATGYCQAPNCMPELPGADSGWYYIIGG